MTRGIAESKRRLSVYFSDDRLEKLERITEYFKQEELLSESKNLSQNIGYMIDTFDKLFLENGSPTMTYQERLSQLLEKKHTPFDELKRENRQLKRQMDQLLYVSLANFHLNANPDWDVQELESVSSDYDAEQKQLLERIAQVLKEDVERGQVIKHSHKH